MEEGRKIILTAKHMFYSENGFFRDDPESQRYCLLLQQCSEKDLMSLYSHFINGIHSKYGPLYSGTAKFVRIGKSHLKEDLIKLINLEEIFILIHAPERINIGQLSNKIYTFDMDGIELDQESLGDITYTVPQRDLLESPPSFR